MARAAAAAAAAAGRLAGPPPGITAAEIWAFVQRRVLWSAPFLPHRGLPLDSRQCSVSPSRKELKRPLSPRWEGPRQRGILCKIESIFLRAAFAALQRDAANYMFVCKRENCYAQNTSQTPPVQFSSAYSKKIHVRRGFSPFHVRSKGKT